MEQLIKQIISERSKQRISYKQLSIITKIPIQRIIELEKQSNYILSYKLDRTKRYIKLICKELSIKIDPEIFANKKRITKVDNQYYLAAPSSELIYITMFLFIITIIIYAVYIDTDSMPSNTSIKELLS
jgi:hypothetical protein